MSQSELVLTPVWQRSPGFSFFLFFFSQIPLKHFHVLEFFTDLLSVLFIFFPSSSEKACPLPDEIMSDLK